MRRELILIGALFGASATAFGQSAAPPVVSPEQFQAISQKLSEEINAELQWRTEALTQQAKVKELEVQLAKGKETSKPAVALPK